MSWEGPDMAEETNPIKGEKNLKNGGKGERSRTYHGTGNIMARNSNRKADDNRHDRTGRRIVQDKKSIGKSVPPAKSQSPLRFLLSNIGRGWPFLILSLVFSMASALAYGPGLAFCLRNFTDSMVSQDRAGVMRAAAFLFLIALTMGSGITLSNYAVSWLCENISLELRKRILAKVLRAPCAYLESRQSGDTVSCLVNDVESTKGALGALLDFVSQAFLVGASLSTLFAWSFPVALTVIILAFLCASSGAIFARPVKEVSDTYQGNLARISEMVTGLLTGLSVIKSLEKEKVMNQKFRKVSDSQYETGKVRGKVLATQDAFSTASAEISSTTLLLVAGTMAFAGKITPGQAIGLMQLGSIILWPLSSLGGRWAGIQQQFAGVDRVAKALAIPQEDYGFDIPRGVPQGAQDARARMQPDGTDLNEDQRALQDRTSAEDKDSTHPHSPPLCPTISFSSVTFGYSQEKKVLSKASFKIFQGQKVAVVGASGSGKSTLGKLLLRFYEPQEGTVAVFGRDIREIPLASLRKEISLVSQEPFIFPGTIKENIMLGNPEASMDQVIRASIAARAHDFISELPDGYETRLEERGKNLSGGQKQRICLARALLKEAPILLLDEPTSSVDPESERLISEAVRSLGAGRTIITISHTQEMIQDADAVLEIQEGRVEASPAENSSN